jgi:hypothetical protein
VKEVIASIKDKLKLIEDTFDSQQDEQKQNDLTIKLNRINKDLRGIIFFQLAITKNSSTLQPKR